MKTKSVKNKLLKNEDLLTELKRLTSAMYHHAYDNKNQPMLDAVEAADYYHLRKPIAAITGGSRTVAPIIKSKVDDAVIQIMDIIGRLREGTRVKGKNGLVIPEQLQAHIINTTADCMWGQVGNKNLTSAIKDSFICGTSALRWFVETEDFNNVEIIPELDLMELELLKSELLPNQTCVVLTEEIIDGIPAPDNKLYTVQKTTFEKKKVVKYENIPFNHLYVDPHCSTIKEAKYVCIESITTKSDLIAQGYDEELVMNSTTEDYFHEQAQVNSNIQFIPSWSLGTEYNDKKASEVAVKEHYVYTSLIDKKATRLYKIVMIGSSVLDITPEDYIPVVEIIPIPNISTFWGSSYAYQLRSQQDSQTAMIRGYIDNIHNANHGRVMALKNSYNKRDLMDNRPNGVVEIDVPNAVSPFPYNPLPQGIDNLMAHIERNADDISGVSNEMLGRSDAVWNSNVAASTTAMNYSKGDLSIKAYAQGIIFGLQELAKGIYGEYCKVNPSPIGNIPIAEFSMTFETEAGRTGKAMKAIQSYKELAQTPYMTPQLQFELIKEYLANASQGSMTQFLKPVQQVMQEQQQPNPSQQLQMQLMQEQINNLQAQSKLTLQKSDIEADEAASDQNRKDLELKFKMELEAKKLNLADRNQTNSEFKTAIDAELAQQELQSKNLALVYEAKYKDTFNANEIVR